MSMHRRALLAGSLAAAWAGGAGAQSAVGGPTVAATGRLQARPQAGPSKAPLGPGLHRLGLDARDAHLMVPAGLDPAKPTPLVVMFHGRGQMANEVMGEWKRAVNRNKVLLMAPQSRDFTWNLDDGPVGPDAVFVDRALAALFARFAVDPKKIAIAGFSEGASYALSMGMVNGDFFSDVLAFAALRFHAPGSIGYPRLFFSHGRRDQVAGFANGKSMARQLQGEGYDVEVHDFDGGHMVDEDGIKKGLARFLRG